MTAVPDDLRAALDASRKETERLEGLYMMEHGKRAPATHGTDAGYGAHRKDKTPQCAPCKAAHAYLATARYEGAVNGHAVPDPVDQRLF